MENENQGVWESDETLKMDVKGWVMHPYKNISPSARNGLYIYPNVRDRRRFLDEMLNDLLVKSVWFHFNVVTGKITAYVKREITSGDLIKMEKGCIGILYVKDNVNFTSSTRKSERIQDKKRRKASLQPSLQPSPKRRKSERIQYKHSLYPSNFAISRMCNRNSPRVLTKRIRRKKKIYN